NARSTTPGHTSPTSMYFGNDATGRYAANQSGALLSPTIDLRGVTGQVAFDFHYFLNASGPVLFRSGDTATVTGVEGANRTVVASNAVRVGALKNTTSFQNLSLDLTQFDGKVIQVEFAFAANTDTAVGEGWYIDDVRLRSTSTDVASVAILSGGNT